MNLYLMRHADAIEHAASDFARVLSDKGQKQAERMGDWLKAMKPDTFRIVSSPYPRARETADIVARRLGKAWGAQQDERLACGMTPDMAAGLMHEFGGDAGLMLVGHAPDLGILASSLLGAKDVSVEMRKGAVACFELHRAGFGGGVLQWLITPKL